MIKISALIVSIGGIDMKKKIDWNEIENKLKNVKIIHVSLEQIMNFRNEAVPKLQQFLEKQKTIQENAEKIIKDKKFGGFYVI